MHRSWYIQLNPHTRNPKWKSEVQDEKLKQFQGDSVEYMKLRSLYFGRTAKIQTLGLRVIAFISGTVQPVKNTSWIFFSLSHPAFHFSTPDFYCEDLNESVNLPPDCPVGRHTLRTLQTLFPGSFPTFKTPFSFYLKMQLEKRTRNIRFV